MNRTKIINLLTYYLIFSSNNNIHSHISYFVEKYNHFFKEKPNEEICKKIMKKNSYFINKTNLVSNMNNFRFTLDDENYYIYFFTYYLIMRVQFIKDGKYKYDVNCENKNYKLNKIIRVYKEFFEDFEPIINTDKSTIAHQLIREEVEKYVIENKRLFSLLKIKENIVMNKDI